MPNDTNAPTNPTESLYYGKNAVLALLNSAPERVFRILLSQGNKADRRLREIHALAESHGIRIQPVPRHKLDQRLDDQPGDAVHQGVIAIVAPKPLLDIHTFSGRMADVIKTGQHPLVLLLDGVTDPRNFGAILRVADAAGVSGVVIAKRNSPGFGPAVSKSASGAEATVDVVVVPNLTQAAETLKKTGFWLVATTMNTAATVYFQQDYAMPTVLVLGSEGEGIHQNLMKHCDFKVRIPMAGQISSLNVATATAVLVFDAMARTPTMAPAAAAAAVTTTP